MRGSKSLRSHQPISGSGILCETCIIKQIIDNADAAYWPDPDGKWSYYLPEVEMNGCTFVRRIMAGAELRDDDMEDLKDCNDFVPQISWLGLRRDETKIVKELFEFILLSTNISPESTILINEFNKIRSERPGTKIMMGGNGSEVESQFGFERSNYTVFALVRDKIAEVHSKKS